MQKTRNLGSSMAFTKWNFASIS